MNQGQNSIIYILLGLLVCGGIAWFCLKPIPLVKVSYDTLERTKTEHASKKAECDKKVREYQAWLAQKEKEKQAIEETQQNVKKIFKPEYYVESDKMSMFGGMLQDIINLAKANNLKVRSLQFYSELEGEPLLMGRAVPPPAAPAEGGEQAPAEPAMAVSQYKGYEVDFGFVGSYSNLKNFTHAVNDYNYLVKIRKMESYPYNKNPKLLLATVSLILYAEMP